MGKKSCHFRLPSLCPLPSGLMYWTGQSQFIHSSIFIASWSGSRTVFFSPNLLIFECTEPVTQMDWCRSSVSFHFSRLNFDFPNRTPTADPPFASKDWWMFRLRPQIYDPETSRPNPVCYIDLSISKIASLKD